MDVDTICRMMYWYKRYRRIYKFLKRKQRENFTLKITKLAFQALARYVKIRDGERCFVCGHDIMKDLSAHHIQPKSDFPELFWEEDNLITLCRFCHIDIHGIEEFPYLSRSDVDWYYAELERRKNGK